MLWPAMADYSWQIHKYQVLQWLTDLIIQPDTGEFVMESNILRIKGKKFCSLVFKGVLHEAGGLSC